MDEEKQAQLLKLMAAELDMRAALKRERAKLEKLEKSLEVQKKAVKEYKEKYNLTF